MESIQDDRFCIVPTALETPVFIPFCTFFPIPASSRSLVADEEIAAIGTTWGTRAGGGSKVEGVSMLRSNVPTDETNSGSVIEREIETL